MQKLITAFKEGNIQFIQDEFTRVINEQLTPFIQESFISESAKEEDVVGHKLIQIAGRRYDFNKQILTKDDSIIEGTLTSFITELVRMIKISAEHTYRGILSGDNKSDIDFTQYIYPFTSQTLYSYSPHDPQLNLIVDYEKYDFIKMLYQDSEYNKMYSVVTELHAHETYSEFPLIMFNPSILYFRDIRDELKFTFTEDEQNYYIELKKIYEYGFTDTLNKETLIVCKREDI